MTHKGCCVVRPQLNQLFSGENKKNVMNLASAEVKVEADNETTIMK